MKQKPQPEMATILLAFITFISLGMGGGLLGLAWPSMAAEFNVRLEDQGILLLTMTVGLLVTSFYSGTLIQRFGTGRLAVFGTGAIALSLLSITVTPSWFLLIASMLVYGIGAGTIDGIINSYAAQHHSERVMNWLHACFGIGMTLTPLVMTAIFAADLSWRTGYGLVCAVVAGVMVLLLVQRSAWRDATLLNEDDDTPAERISMSATLKLPVVWIGIAMLFLVAAMETTPGNWSFTLFTEGRGISEVAAAQWVSVFWGSFTVGRIFFGAIISRVNTQTLVYVCLVGAMVGAGMLAWNAAPWMGFAGLTLLGFAQAPIYPVLTSNTPRRVGRQHAPNAIGFQVASAGVGLSAIPALAGFLAGLSSFEIIPVLIFAGTGLLLILYQISISMSAAKAKRELVEG